MLVKGIEFFCRIVSVHSLGVQQHTHGLFMFFRNRLPNHSAKIISTRTRTPSMRSIVAAADRIDT